MECNIIDYLRKPKVAGMSIFDLVGTFLVAVLIGYLINMHRKFKISLWINIIVIFFLLLILGVIIHKIFGIPTMLNYYLGLNSYDEVIAKRKKC